MPTKVPVYLERVIEYVMENSTGDLTASSVQAGVVNAEDVIGNAVFPSLDDIPADLQEEGNQVYVQDEQKLHVWVEQ